MLCIQPATLLKTRVQQRCFLVNLGNRSSLNHLRSVLLLMAGKSGNCLHSCNIRSNVGSCDDGHSCKFRELFQPANRLKRRVQHMCFLVNLENFLKQQLYPKRDSGAGVSFCMIIARLAYNSYCSSKGKKKR